MRSDRKASHPASGRAGAGPAAALDSTVGNAVMQPTDAVSGSREARQPACRSQHVLFLLRKVDCNDGIASYCQTLAAGLAARGISVSIISGHVNADTGSQRRREDLRRILGHWWSFPGLKQYPQPRLLAKFVAFIKENNIAAINVHGLGMLMWGRALSLAAGVPLVATYHPSLSGDMDSPGASSAPSFTPMQRLFLRLYRPDRLVVLSEEAKDFIARQCPPIEPRIVKSTAASMMGSSDRRRRASGSPRVPGSACRRRMCSASSSAA